jgi:hypothetical protein
MEAERDVFVKLLSCRCNNKLCFCVRVVLEQRALYVLENIVLQELHEPRTEKGAGTEKVAY